MDSVKVSVPVRLDIGGTWDLPPLLYFGQAYQPSTITIALDLRVAVRMSRHLPTTQSRITLIGDADESMCWTGCPEQYDYTGVWGLVQAVLGFYQLTGVDVTIQSDVPAQIGLGGSGALCVALIVACRCLLDIPYCRAGVAREAHDIESGFFSMTGYQDQLSALSGGVRLWQWHHPPEQCEGVELLPVEAYPELSSRLALAIVGRHVSSEINAKQLQSFMVPGGRSDWVELNEHTVKAGMAIMSRDWQALVRAVQAEHGIRNRLVPERIAGMMRFIDVVEHSNVISDTVAWGTAGAGQAALWCVACNPDILARIKHQWRDLGAIVLSTNIATEGCIYQEG